MRITLRHDEESFLVIEEADPGTRWGSEFSFDAPMELVLQYRAIAQNLRDCEARLVAWQRHCHNAVSKEGERCRGSDDACTCDCARCKSRALIPRGDNLVSIWDAYVSKGTYAGGKFWLGCVLGTSESTAAERASLQYKIEPHKITVIRRFA